MGNSPAASPKKPHDAKGFRVSSALGSTDRIRDTRTLRDKGNASFCKVCVIGESKVGKTSLVNWLAHKPFDPKWQATVGVEQVCTTLTVEQHAWKLQLWDSAGIERYRINIATFFEDAAAAIVVVDCTKSAWDNIGNASMWRDQLLLHTKNDLTPILLVATKAGLTDQRKLQKSDLQEFILASNAHYIEVECSVPDEDMHTLLAELIVSNVPEKAITKL
eukprot:TRINITY_DN12522_c0_g1_i4.p1 TRINITY_DN12522_c0_g1~~TRINITY_DN12522_c0_g1_i4.p1  ORF type:complete len:219 (-),score=50.98 TRINITY_DN12522_c0_g1_i4:218-874(-)